MIRDIAPPSTLASNLYARAYRPIIQAWTDATPRIVSSYERTLSAMVTDAPADIQAEINATAGLLERLFLLLTPDIRDWALMTERTMRRKWIGAVLSAASVDLTTLLGTEDVRASLDTHISWNVALVRDVSDVTRQRISSAVFDGLRNRTPARDVAKTITEAVGISRRRALNISSDQTSKLTSSLADERRRQASILEWSWVHSKKLHPRQSHQARDGKVYSDDPSRVGQSINGKTIEPLPPTRPGQEPYCGCRSKSVISLD
ncbi:phage minor head protein [Sphingobium sp. BS19]|uniref:phage minor head protein n=1 Tax=Sphingobium sp. BS19 TaxID=3018973 RepID=UPI0024912934|nr:phage minor head protein [Sphingobium sp. BS19]